MQLNNHKVKSALFAASCSLLGGQAIAADGWNFDTAVMFYGETDRVQALEGIFKASKTYDNEGELSTKLVIDSLTGASASGAVPQNTPQTYTSPSGNGQYQTPANETPLDDTFKDTRAQVAAQWSQPLSENYIYSTGANFSKEYDYLSFGLNGMIGRYLNNKNTTMTMGLSYAFDNVDPVGGQPIGLSAMVVDDGSFVDEAAYRSAFNATRFGDGDSKNTIDLVFGVTQVMNRRWLTQFNLSISEVDGYLTDPYKLISVVDGSGTVTDQLYENRPDTRSKQALYVQSKYHFDQSIWDVSYRFTTDDWGVQSHTLESRYRFLLANGGYLEPHVRFYQQNEADFYKPFLSSGDPLPTYASADYRIGQLNTYTLGLKYGKKLKDDREYGVRVEYYNQAPQDIGVQAPGQLSSLELYPSVDALILQFDYKF